MSDDFAPNGAHAILETLRRWGVTQVFICPGSTEAPFLDASMDYPDIELVLTTHESAAVSMADGFARATGRPGVVYLHTNVGLTNGLANLYSADVAGSPVVVLTGLKSTRIQNRRGFTTSPYMRDLVRPYCRWDWHSLDAEAVAEDLDRALMFATSTPTGPTYLGLAQDLLQTDSPVPIPKLNREAGDGYSGRSRPDDRDLLRAAEALAEASRPIIVAGGEVAKANGLPALLALAERLSAPVLVEDRRTLEVATFPMDHPQYAGAYRPDDPTVQEADLILLAGARTFIEFEPAATSPIPAHATLIHLHPHAGEVARLYPTHLGLVGDASLGLEALAAALPSSDPAVEGARKEFLGRAVNRTVEHDAKMVRLAEELRDHHPIAVPALMHELSLNLRPGTVVVADAVTSEPMLMTYVKQREVADYHTTAAGALGWGMGAAVGIKLGRPDRDVVAVLGDGVFQFGIQALWTAVDQGTDVTFLVVNNRAYAAVRSALYRFGGRAARSEDYPASNISGPRIDAIAMGYGLHAERVEKLDELSGALDRAWQAAGPALIEVLTDPDDIGPGKPRFVPGG